MANTDNNQPTVRSLLASLTSPTTMAALRYALTAISPLFALFGLAILTPDQIEHVITYAQTFGLAVSAVLTLLGIAIPLLMAIFGVVTSTVKKQIERVREIATNPALADEEAQKAIVAATRALASSAVPKSAEAVQTLVDTTISLPQVKTIVASDQVAFNSPSNDVVSEKKAAVIPK